MNPGTTPSERELAHRTSNGIEVSLFWNEQTNHVTVKVYDTRSDEGFELDVDGHRALDVYRHPFAHATAEQTGKRMFALGKRDASWRQGFADAYGQPTASAVTKLDRMRAAA